MQTFLILSFSPISTSLCVSLRHLRKFLPIMFFNCLEGDEVSRKEVEFFRHPLQLKQWRIKLFRFFGPLLFVSQTSMRLMFVTQQFYLNTSTLKFIFSFRPRLKLCSLLSHFLCTFCRRTLLVSGTAASHFLFLFCATTICRHYKFFRDSLRRWVFY